MFLLLVALLAPTAAQIRLTTIELAAHTEEGVLLHVRVPRGQTITEAALLNGGETLPLEIASVPLPQTQWVLVDSSDAMINLQSSVSAALDRFLRGSEQASGLIFFGSDLQILQPSEGNPEIADFLVRYTATAGEPACLAPALNMLNDTVRSYQRSWRILLITAGDFSQANDCPPDAMPSSLPAPIEIIAINDTIDPVLTDLVDANGGEILTANLRTVEARINEVRTLWGQPTYALQADVAQGWAAAQPLELQVSLSGGGEETVSVALRDDYTRPVAPPPTPEATEITLATIPPRADENGESAVVDVVTDASSDTDQIALLLIAGAGLFIVGAVILALALMRVQRTPDEHTTTSDDFYNTLDSSPPDHGSSSSTATKIRERELLEEVDITRIAGAGASRFTPMTEEDALLVTRVLTDAHVQSMMQQSLADDEIVGFVRVEGQSPGDYEVRRRGLLIGRSTDCDVQITGDPAISRHHARLDMAEDDNSLTVSRLSAINPVIVGGVQVRNKHPLRPNDVIHLSDATRLVFIAKQDDEG